MLAFRQLFLFVPVITVSGNLGASECPCITNASARYADYVATVAATSGLPTTYGLTGCAAHDANVALFGCSQNQGAYCSNPWCFVDPDLCPEDESLCEAAGGELGSLASPHCRTRKSNPSMSLLNISGAYSYETCGSVNVYDVSELNAPVAGRTLRAAAAAWAPWIITTRNLRDQEVWGGPSYDFFEETLQLFDPQPTIDIIPGWATQASRMMFPASSYTACVHDVAVGNFDICLADLWLTPERNQLVTFLPAVRSDYFYLVVPKNLEVKTDITFLSRLEKPFLPFTPGAWMAVVGFLCIMSTLLWLRQLCETGCHGDLKTNLRVNVVSFLRSLFFVWHDFLLGQSSMDVENGPVRQIFSLALAFFILITLASYTASLASLLVVQQQSAGTVESIEDAIGAGMKICAPTSLLATFNAVYPRAQFVGVEIDASARTFHAGNCSAMVLSEDVINSLFGGKLREADCAAQQDGTLTAEQAQCKEQDRDCNFLRVGDLLWSVPLSFPINEKMAHSFSWAFTAAITRGKFEEARRTNLELFPTSICEVEEASEGQQLTFDDLSGTMFISFSVMLVGFFVMGVRHYCRQRKRSADKKAEEEQEPMESQPVVVKDSV